MVQISLEETIQRTERKRGFNPFSVDDVKLKRIVNSGFKNISVLDTNILIDNSTGDAVGYHRKCLEDEQSFDKKTFDILADRNSSVYTTGITLTEMLGLEYKDTIKALKEKPNYVNKIINVFDNRVTRDVLGKRVDRSQFRNIKEMIEVPYGIISSNKEIDSLYTKATTAFNNAKTVDEKNTATFKYFMTAAVDAARNIETDKIQDNIFCDAYNIAFGLLLGSKINETQSESKVVIASDDEDLRKIYNVIWDNLETDSYRSNANEAELRSKLDSAIEKITDFESQIGFMSRMKKADQRYAA